MFYGGRYQALGDILYPPLDAADAEDSGGLASMTKRSLFIQPGPPTI
jgi:hypothetical protein